uniref:OmpA family protein n=2 Tax=Flavobacterium sp. TaxID=239 RepID=UPI004049AE0D
MNMRIITKLTLVMLLVSSTAVFAQEEDEMYNQWSVEAGVGTSNLTGLISNDTYYNEAFDPISFNLGARYMFNRRFGVKFAFGMDKVENAGIGRFDATFLHLNTNAVVNLGQMFDFQQFTNRVGLLMNVGVGYTRFSLDKNLSSAAYVNRDNEDNMLNAQVGFTVQGRLTDKLVLNLDLTQKYLGLRTMNLDGTRNNSTSRSRVDGGILNFSFGLTYYLGSNDKHIDWTPYEVAPDLTNELEELQHKIAELEDAAVSQNELMKVQKQMDEKIQEGIIKASEIAQAAVNNNASNNSGVSPEFLMNNDYVAAYFEFNKRKPTNVSTNGIDFLVTYLRKNPAASVTIIGYADEIGDSAYNQKLASDRAESVKNMVIKAGIDAARISIKSGGEDNSVDPESDLARTIVRRVVFRVN